MKQQRAVVLSDAERSLLEALIRAGSTAQQLVARAQLILALACGHSLAAIAQELNTWPQRVARWRNRWLDSDPKLPVCDRLADEPRPGAPGKITAEQYCQIIALACERPDAHEVPITHWSSSELARAAVAKGIVPSISARSVGRILKRCRPQTPFGPPLADAKARSRL